MERACRDEGEGVERAGWEKREGEGGGLGGEGGGNLALHATPNEIKIRMVMWVTSAPTPYGGQKIRLKGCLYATDMCRVCAMVVSV